MIPAPVLEGKRQCLQRMHLATLMFAKFQLSVRSMVQVFLSTLWDGQFFSDSKHMVGLIEVAIIDQGSDCFDPLSPNPVEHFLSFEYDSVGKG